MKIGKTTIAIICLFLVINMTLLTVSAIRIEKKEFFSKTFLTSEITVPDDYPTIQEAINHAHPNAKIRVKEGIYKENILVNKKGLILEGDNPYNTIIDGSQKGDVITIDISTYEFDQEVIIKQFTITNSGLNHSGIKIKSWGSAIIKENIIKNNGVGIETEGEDPNYNTIYLNNIVNNLKNAYDCYQNHWYSIELSQGNYWSDYQGEDTDGDGYGDTGYRIPCALNKDWRPKITPYEWECSPDKPIIFGTTIGEPNAVYTYTIVTTDVNKNRIKYNIHWGDEEETTDFYDSGEEIYLTHSWPNEGNYIIRVKAIDETGLESDFSKLKIYIPRYYNILQKFPIITNIFEKLTN